MEAAEKMSRLGEKAKHPPWSGNGIFSNFEQDSTSIIIQRFFKILSQKLVAEYPGNTFSGNVSLVDVALQTERKSFANKAQKLRA